MNPDNSSASDMVPQYKILTKIGHGTFGEVFKCKNIETSQEVAMKKVLVQNETNGFPLTTIREIKLLKVMNHENIVNLIEVCWTGKTTWLVFEFCEHDLAGLLANSQLSFDTPEIKNILKQIFEGLFYIHSNNILHRDMKPSNILVTKEGNIKIADFGLAKAVSGSTTGRKKPMTPEVVTLWYRAPEIILRQRNYGPAVDIWSMGCIMVEIWTRAPLFKADTPQMLLIQISKLCGSINERSWKGVEQLELFQSLDLSKKYIRQVTRSQMPNIQDALACDLLEKLLILDPIERITAAEALDHDFFWSDPMPKSIKSKIGPISSSKFCWYTEKSCGITQQAAKRQRIDEDSAYVDRIW